MTFHPDQERSTNQLKKTYNKLVKTQMGTVNSTIPADVCETKEIHRLIIEKSEGATGTGDESFAAGDEEEDIEDVEDNNGAAEEG
jgi:hypothetical protein